MLNNTVTKQILLHNNKKSQSINILKLIYKCAITLHYIVVISMQLKMLVPSYTIQRKKSIDKSTQIVYNLIKSTQVVYNLYGG